MQAAAVDVEQFARTNPGVYAMGDRAGSVGYLLRDPVVQTEGLVMDREFLESVRQELPLERVLARYGTRYYVGNARRPVGQCFDASGAGASGHPFAASAGTFCGPPLATFVHKDHYTVVYAMSQAVTRTQR